jgi:peptidase E
VPGEIIAMGGGGFSMEPDNPCLDDFILSRARRQPARICFVPTASGDAATYVVRFYRAFAGRGCVPTDLTLNDNPALPRQPEATCDLAAFVADQDILYVGGGNTAHLLALWRVHGLDAIVRDAWAAGAVLCGISAGMICWFAAGVTDSYGPLAPLHDGLGLIGGSACPHYDGEADRRPRYHELIANGFPAGYAADDGAALWFSGGTLAGVVASRPGAAGYRVELRDGAVVEERLEARLLTAEGRRGSRT